MNKLLALADRVEKLTGPDREVDAEIAAVQDLHAVDEGHPLGWQCYDAEGRITAFRRYTASIDHAMTLVPENAITSLANEQRWKKPAWSWGINDKHGVTHFGSAATPALAILAASLRARAHGGGEG